MTKLTINTIVHNTKNTQPYYFDSKTLRFFGQNLGSFKVYTLSDNTTGIIAPIYASNNDHMGYSTRIYTGDDLLICTDDQEKELIEFYHSKQEYHSGEYGE